MISQKHLVRSGKNLPALSDRLIINSPKYPLNFTKGMITIENKYNVGDKVYVIGRRQNQGNVLEVKEVTIVALGASQDPKEKVASANYWFKVDPTNDKEKEGVLMETQIYATPKEAKAGLIEAGKELRTHYKAKIDELNKEKNRLQAEADKILYVEFDETAFVPSAEDKEKLAPETEVTKPE